LTACKTSAPDRAVQTSTSFSDTRAEVENVKVQIASVFTALNQLITQPGVDLRPQFKDYVKAVDRLDSVAGKLGKRSEAMQAKGEAYFAEWDTQIAAINDADLKTLSQDRRNQALASYQKVRDNMVKGKEAFQPFMSVLRDIQNYLGTNLTNEGVAAMKSRVDTAKKDAIAVQDAANAVIAELDKAIQAISPKSAAK